MKRNLKKILKILEWGLTALAVIIFMLMLSPLLPTKNFLGSYAVVSGSMEPTIMTGSIGFIKPISTELLKQGDIIAFAEPQDMKTTILHRIQSVKNLNGQPLITTKGDANKSADNWTVNPKEIKGKYLFSIPYVGYLTELVKKPLGFLLVIGLPALALIILQIKMIKDGIEQEIQRRVKKAVSTQRNPHFFKIELILFLTLSLALLTPTAHSLLHTEATISGITLATKNTFAEISTSVRDHKVIITITNLSTYTKLEYTLNYHTDTTTQEVTGQDSVDGNTYQKSILLGTCSTNSCVYDTDPHDFTLEVTLTNTQNHSVTVEKSF